jgi:hypothetical protein
MPAFRIFQDENTVFGLTPGTDTPIQAGVSNKDSSQSQPEANLKLSWPANKRASWISYRCWIETELDAGIALHKPLPQTQQVPDTLASIAVDDKTIEDATAGVNTVSENIYADVTQQMATSLYIFKLRGWGYRAGYQIPIPGLVTVAGVPAIPAQRQIAANIPIANYSGVILWHAYWDLWYYVTLPPKQLIVPPPNVAQHVSSNMELLAQDNVALPISQPDPNATQQRVLQGGAARQ